MACSKYVSTKETRNAARVSWLLLNPCADLFRDILRNHVTEIQFPGVLQNKRNILIPILNRGQRENLYPKSSIFTGTYAEFDLSLLYILLRNISGIPPHKEGWGRLPNPLDRSLSANIDRIRGIRNSYCGHSPSIALSNSEFQKVWQNLTVIINELEGSLPGECPIYSDAAKTIKNASMDPEREERFLDTIDDKLQLIEHLKELEHRIEILKTQLKVDEQQTQSTKSHLKLGLELPLEKQTAGMEDLLKIIKQRFPIETTHAARLSRLICGPCTDLFRDILKNWIPEIQFQFVLQKKKRNLIQILNKNYKEQLYPRSGNFSESYEHFDLSLLYLLLRNISGIPPHRNGWGKSPDPFDRSLSANIERIREIRNTLTSTSRISDSDSDSVWQDLIVIISELEECLPGDSKVYSEAARIIKTDIMDPELKDMYQDIIEKQNKLIKELKETTFGGNVEKAETQRTHEIQKPSEEEETLKSSAEKSEKLKQDPGILDMIKHLRKCLAIVRAVTQDKSTQKLTVILENIERIAGHSHGKEIPLKFISDIKVLRDIIEIIHLNDEVLPSLCEEVENRKNKVIQINVGQEQQKTQKIIVIVFDGAYNFDVEAWEGYPVKWKHWRCPPEEGAYISGLEKILSFNEEAVYKMEIAIKQNARKLFQKHSNLEFLSISAYHSQRNGELLKTKWCIALYCSCKGVVPLTEEVFPKSIHGFPTDIREGFFYLFPNGANERFSKNPKDVLKPLVMGCSIGGMSRNMEGTLGGFVSFDNGASQELGFITAAHILFDQHQTSDIEIVQPSYGVQNENNVCGVHIRSVFPTQQDKYGVSVDASLIKLTKRFPDRGTFSGYTVVDLLELGFSKEKPPEYDTDEIRDYRGNKIWTERRNRCCKSGQSSQFTQGCLKLNGFSGKYLESIELLSNPSASSGFYYYSQLEINHIKGLKDFAQPGDSGALVFQIDSQECDKDDKLVCIGMVVGGTSIDTTVVTPIASVLEELNVKLLPLKSEAMEI